MPDYTSWFNQIAKGGSDNPIDVGGFAQGMQQMAQAREAVTRNRLMKMQMDEAQKTKQLSPQTQQQVLDYLANTIGTPSASNTAMQPGAQQQQIPPMLARPATDQQQIPVPAQQEQAAAARIPEMLRKPDESATDKMPGEAGPLAVGGGKAAQAAQMQKDNFQKYNNNLKLMNDLGSEIIKAKSPEALETLTKRMNSPEVQSIIQPLGAVPGTFHSEIAQVRGADGIVRGQVNSQIDIDASSEMLAKLGHPGLPDGRYTMRFEGDKRLAPVYHPSLLSPEEIKNDNMLIAAMNGPDKKKAKEAQQILDSKVKRMLETTSAKAKQSGSETPPFSQWTKDDKEFYYEQMKATGTPPPFGWGDKVSRSQFAQGYARWNKGQGVSGGEAAAEKTAFTAYSNSIKNQQKVKGMLGSFVKNMNMQVDRVADHMQKIDRIDARILNLPYREALIRVKGSANEAILNMYLTDISNDIGKISTGSSASIRELSVEAQDRWSRIHDPNLPVKDILTILQETKRAGDMRIISADSQIKEDTSALKALGRNQPQEEKPPEQKPLLRVLPAGMTRSQWFDMAKKANPKKTPEELNKIFEQNYTEQR